MQKHTSDHQAAGDAEHASLASEQAERPVVGAVSTEQETLPEHEDIEAVIACLGDDAAQIREELANCRPNGEGFICEEWAESMERASRTLGALLKANSEVAQLLLRQDRESAKDWARGLFINMDVSGGLTVSVKGPPLAKGADCGMGTDDGCENAEGTPGMGDGQVQKKDGAA